MADEPKKSGLPSRMGLGYGAHRSKLGTAISLKAQDGFELRYASRELRNDRRIMRDRRAFFLRRSNGECLSHHSWYQHRKDY